MTAPSRGRALAAGCVGNLVEWYDVAVYGASATVLAAVLTAPGSSGLITVFLVFAMAFLVRPLGAVVVGVRADRRGRRGPLAEMLLLMTGATAAIGLLPPWAAVGALAPLSLAVLRSLQSFSSGGEVSTSVTYLAEYAPPGRLGWFGGWHLATIALGTAAGMAAVAVTGRLLEPAQLTDWGWRVPFLLALPLGTIGLYVRWRIGETPEYLVGRPGPRTSAVDVLRAHGPTVRRGLVLVAALTCAFNTWFVFVPSFLVTTGRASFPGALAGAVAGLVACAVAAPVLGLLSDRVGRRPVLHGAAGALSLMWAPAFTWLRAGTGTTGLVVCNVVVGLALGGFVHSSYLPEHFPVAARATGVGLTFGTASAVVGGTAPLVAALLDRAGALAAVPAYVTAWSAAAFLATVGQSRGRAPDAVRPSWSRRLTAAGRPDRDGAAASRR